MRDEIAKPSEILAPMLPGLPEPDLFTRATKRPCAGVYSFSLEAGKRMQREAFDAGFYAAQPAVPRFQNVSQTRRLQTPYDRFCLLLDDLRTFLIEQGEEQRQRGNDCTAAGREAQAFALGELMKVLKGVQELAIEQPAWQPIRTAPKDGTHILVWTDCSDTAYVVCWADASKGIRRNLIAESGAERGWHLAWDGTLFDREYEPTCWMPLPASPGAAAELGTARGAGEGSL